MTGAFHGANAPITPSDSIYRSTDNGNSWSKLSDVADTQNGWGMRWQPELFELPTGIGDFPAGTILAAGDSVPSDRSATKIDLYASTDRGRTWSFVTNIATGGAAFDTNGQTPVWEPFFLVSDGKLIVYYSDQRDPDHGQKIVHQVSTDARTWGPVVDDVAMPTAGDPAISRCAWRRAGPKSPSGGVPRAATRSYSISTTRRTARGPWRT
ncbi:hypothetical protein GCM10010309_79710 [Streptomyces violaceochromogenes]|nr:hypothetical protein GCM10010309_79710 [Streptomyces violaceochromogenes]